MNNDGLGFFLFALGVLFCEERGWWWGCMWCVFFLSVLHIPDASCPIQLLGQLVFNIRHKRTEICFCVTMNKGQNQMFQEGQTE